MHTHIQHTCINNTTCFTNEHTHTHTYAHTHTHILEDGYRFSGIRHPDINAPENAQQHIKTQKDTHSNIDTPQVTHQNINT